MPGRKILPSGRRQSFRTKDKSFRMEDKSFRTKVKSFRTKDNSFCTKDKVLRRGKIAGKTYDSAVGLH